MPEPTESTPVIAGIGHIYVGAANVKPATGFLDSYKFDLGKETLTGFKWIGDTSSETLPEFESDGGDSNAKRTWDRKDVRVTMEDKSYSVTFASVASTAESINAAFPGSKWLEDEKAWDINLGGSVEKSILIVIEDGEMVAAHLFPRVSLSGSLPTLDLENFSEISISGAIMSPSDAGLPKYRYYHPRKRTAAAGPRG